MILCALMKDSLQNVMSYANIHAVNPIATIDPRNSRLCLNLGTSFLGCGRRFLSAEVKRTAAYKENQEFA